VVVVCTKKTIEFFCNYSSISSFDLQSKFAEMLREMEIVKPFSFSIFDEHFLLLLMGCQYNCTVPFVVMLYHILVKWS
jgi:hypothetical protein